MALEDMVITGMVFAMPVAIVWIKKHYDALARGHAQGALPEKRIAALEARNQELLERVQNLESIVVALEEPVRPKALPTPTKRTTD